MLSFLRFHICVIESANGIWTIMAKIVLRALILPAKFLKWRTRSFPERPATRNPRTQPSLRWVVCALDACWFWTALTSVCAFRWSDCKNQCHFGTKGHHPRGWQALQRQKRWRVCERHPHQWFEKSLHAYARCHPSTNSARNRGR